MDFSKLPPEQKKVVKKALWHLTEARDLLYCCNSPFGHPNDQMKVGKLFTDFVERLKSLK